MQKSNLWKKIFKNFRNVDESFLKNFRMNNNENSRMTCWSPSENSSRWFKFFIYNHLKNKDEKFFELFSNLKNINLGNPTSIKFNNIEVNIDYLLGIEEFTFILDNLNKLEYSSIIEIGAGFGRTAHTFLQLSNNIKEYIIIDLPEMIVLSKKYLESVLDKEDFKKIIFYEVGENIEKIYSDLVININSFQEMNDPVIDQYYENVISNSKYLYLRNAICKYSPSIFDINNSITPDVFSLGRCQNILNELSDSEISFEVENYKMLYLPKNGNWEVFKEKDDLFPYYYNVLYKKL